MEEEARRTGLSQSTSLSVSQCSSALLSSSQNEDNKHFLCQIQRPATTGLSVSTTLALILSPITWPVSPVNTEIEIKHNKPSSRERFLYMGSRLEIKFKHGMIELEVVFSGISAIK